MISATPTIRGTTQAQSVAPPQNVLATHELVKIYGGRAVVNGINVNVRAG